MKALNLGCGKDYKESKESIDWINLDFNREIKADVYHNLNTLPLPFKDNEFDLIYLDNVIEHIPSNVYLEFIDELYRIGKPDSIIQIYTPHYSGMYAFKHPTHYNYFGVGSFDCWRTEECFNGERYGKARFKVKEELLFWHHNLIHAKFLSLIPINWIFNFNRTWQDIMERFQLFGFDEIYFELKVVK